MTCLPSPLKRLHKIKHLLKAPQASWFPVSSSEHFFKNINTLGTYVFVLVILLDFSSDVHFCALFHSFIQEKKRSKPLAVSA